MAVAAPMDDALTGPDPAKSPPAAPPPSASSDGLDQMFGALAASQKRIDQYSQERQAVTGQMRQAIEGDIAQGMPQRPMLELYPESPAIGKLIDQKGASEFFSIAFGLSALAGLKTSTPMISSLNAAAAAINGYADGNQEKAALEFKKFQTDFTRARQVNAERLDAYQTILDDRKTTLKAKLDLLKDTANGYRDEITAENARQGNIRALIQTMEAGRRADERLGLAYAQMQNKVETTGQGMQVKLPNGKFGYWNAAKGDYVRDASGEPVEAAPRASGSAINQRFAFNMSEAYQQAATDLLNVAKMPEGTVLGALSGMTGQTGETLRTSLANTFARQVTENDARMFQQLVSGIESNMSRALGGGYANSGAKHIIDLYKQQAPKAGDSPVVIATFMARVKQELDIFADQYENYPGASPEQIEKMAKTRDAIDRAIPFDVDDVIGAQSRGRPTIGQAGPTGESDQTRATAAFGSYEPDKYEYGINPSTGKFARRPK